MPFAGMNLGSLFENTDWREVVGFVMGLVCVFVAAGAILHRHPTVGRGSAVFAAVAAGQLVTVLAVRHVADMLGYVPMGGFGLLVTGWLWGVALIGLASLAGLGRPDRSAVGPRAPPAEPAAGRHRKKKRRG